MTRHPQANRLRPKPPSTTTLPRSAARTAPRRPHGPRGRRSRGRRLGRFALGFVAAILLPGGRLLPVSNLEVGEALPAFSLPLASGGTAAEYTSEELRGKPAAIVFWRPHQELSLAALRDLDSIARELGEGRAGTVAVDAARSGPREAADALGGQALSFPVLLDPERRLYAQVGVIVCPTTLIFDSSGILRFVLASHPRQYRQVVRARLRYLAGDITEEEMEQAIEPTVLKIDPNVSAAWRMYSLGRKLQAEGKPEEALSAFQEAVTRAPSLAEARCALGFLALSSGSLEAAREHFRSALAHQPTSPWGRLGWAAVLARSGEEAEAEAILLSLFGHRSLSTRVRYELGRIYKARGDSQRALAFYDEALAAIFNEPGGVAAGPPPGVAAAPADRGPPAAAGAPAGAEGTGEERSPAAATAGSPGDVAPLEPREGSSYLGLKACKKCHFQEWSSWKETKMAHAFDLLKPGVRSDRKLGRRLDPEKDYTEDPSCLSCHTTGYGWPGGYPPPGDAGSKAPGEGLAGVTCEACHGPGSEYAPLHKEIMDKKRRYTQQELGEAGQFEVGIRACAHCHSGRNPCVSPDDTFNYEERKTQGTHQHFQLQYRTPQ